MPAPAGCYPHVSSNVQVTFNSALEPGARITRIAIQCPSTGEWVALEEERLYVVAITAFMRNGGDGCTAYCDGEDGREMGAVKDEVIRYLQQCAQTGENALGFQLGGVVDCNS